MNQVFDHSDGSHLAGASREEANSCMDTRVRPIDLRGVHIAIALAA